MNKPKAETFLVGVTYAEDNSISVLIVGKQRPNGSPEIVNAFQGEEATELYKKLIAIKNSNQKAN